MKKSSLNRKFRRALAASLGAVAFASTSCVINAVDQKLYVALKIAQSFAAMDDAEADQLELGSRKRPDARNNIRFKIDGELLTPNIITEKPGPGRDSFTYYANLGKHVNVIQISIKRTNLGAGGAGGGFSKRFRLAPPTAKEIPDPATLVGYIGNDGHKINLWCRDEWIEYRDQIAAEITNQENADKRAEDARQAEENARAERERANSLLSSSGSQNVQVPSTNFNSGIMSASTLAATMIPMTTMMNNTTPVHTTTSSMVNNVNTMGTQVGPKADINNTNSQINHNANVVEVKTKT